MTGFGTANSTILRHTCRCDDGDMRANQIMNTLGIAARVLKSVVMGGNLESLRLVARPRRQVEYISECLLLSDSLRARTKSVQHKHVHEAFGAQPAENIVLGNLTAGAEHWLWGSYALDIVSLCLLCRLVRPRLVFEIGTLRGYTAYHFALNTADDAQILTLDLPKDATRARPLPTTVLDDAYVERHQRVARYDFEDTPVATKITRLVGDSATFDYSPYHARVDLFFIDGAHAYEYVASDTRHALACCRPGGIIAWHDFGRVGVEGVTRCVREMARQREVFVVPGGSVAFMRV